MTNSPSALSSAQIRMKKYHQKKQLVQTLNNSRSMQNFSQNHKVIMPEPREALQTNNEPEETTKTPVNETDRLRSLVQKVGDLVPSSNIIKLEGKRPNLVSDVLAKQTFEAIKPVRPNDRVPKVVTKFQKAVHKLIMLNRSITKTNNTKKLAFSTFDILGDMFDVN